MTEQTAEDERSKDAGEIDTLPDHDLLSGLARSLNNIFPDLKCLRCGSEKFFLAGPAYGVYQSGGDANRHARLGRGDADIEKIDLICRHCGMIESHAMYILQDAAKHLDEKK